MPPLAAALPPPEDAAAGAPATLPAEEDAGGVDLWARRRRQGARF